MNIFKIKTIHIFRIIIGNNFNVFLSLIIIIKLKFIKKKRGWSKVIRGILTFQFILNQTDSGEIEPEFRPIELVFGEEQEYTENNYQELIKENDIFAVFYNHTTGIQKGKEKLRNFYSGRLKESPFQVISYYRQEEMGTQFLTISIFNLTDEIGIFEELINKMASRLDLLYGPIEKAMNANQISILTNIRSKMRNELKFTLFQVMRLSNLDKIQKAASIFNNDERIEMLKILRKHPISKTELKEILEMLKENINIELLLDPFLELNLIRRDWIEGKRDKKTGKITNQGEYLFLVKDILIARVPNIKLLDHLKEVRKDLYDEYERRLESYFLRYDPNTQSIEETQSLAALLLDPDIYDNIALMRSKFYPRDKIPNIFSDFADSLNIIDKLLSMDILTEIRDNKGREWLFLMCDIKPLILFPEYLIPKIREAYRGEEKEGIITLEIAKKAYDLLETTYDDKIEF